MKPAQFEYAEPRTVDEVLSLLSERGDGAKILAGGQSLVPLLNMRLSMPDLVIDINRLEGQRGLDDDGQKLSMGPLVRQNDVERASRLDERHPLLKEAIKWVGHPQIRNRGTVLGSLAHGDPSAELPLVFQAMEGTMQIASARGSRLVSAEEFFVHIMTTAVEPDEMLERASLPHLPRRTGTAFLEVARRHGDFAVAAVAVVLTVDGAACTRARIAMGGVGPVPTRARRAEEWLVGCNPDASTFHHAGSLAAAESEPVSDVHGTVEYRRDVMGVLVRRALTLAAERARHDPIPSMGQA